MQELTNPILELLTVAKGSGPPEGFSINEFSGPRTGQSSAGNLYVVCEGPVADMASAVGAIRDAYHGDPSASVADVTLDVLKRAMAAANEVLERRASLGISAVVAVATDRGELYVAYAGNCHCFLFRAVDGVFERVTKREFSRKFLGASDTVAVGEAYRAFRPGDIAFLLTGSILDSVTEGEIESIATEAGELGLDVACEMILERAYRRDPTGKVTAVLVGANAGAGSGPDVGLGETIAESVEPVVVESQGSAGEGLQGTDPNVGLGPIVGPGAHTGDSPKRSSGHASHASEENQARIRSGLPALMMGRQSNDRSSPTGADSKDDSPSRPEDGVGHAESAADTTNLTDEAADQTGSDFDETEDSDLLSSAWIGQPLASNPELPAADVETPAPDSGGVPPAMGPGDVFTGGLFADSFLEEWEQATPVAMPLSDPALHGLGDVAPPAEADASDGRSSAKADRSEDIGPPRQEAFELSPGSQTEIQGGRRPFSRLRTLGRGLWVASSMVIRGVILVILGLVAAAAIVGIATTVSDAVANSSDVATQPVGTQGLRDGDIFTRPFAQQVDPAAGVGSLLASSISSELALEQVDELTPAADAGEVGALRRIVDLLDGILRTQPRDAVVEERLEIAQRDLAFRQRMAEVDSLWGVGDTDAGRTAAWGRVVEILEGLRAGDLQSEFAVAVEDRLYPAHISYGASLEAAGRSFEALGNYERARKLKPNRSEAKAALARFE